MKRSGLSDLRRCASTFSLIAVAVLCSASLLPLCALSFDASRSDFTRIAYDGVADDLLTGGLGKTGLQGAAPMPADSLAPTAAELRRLAIYSNYRAMMDCTTSGGFGLLYGPNVNIDGNPTTGEGLVAGAEYLSFAEGFSESEHVTLMVQIPNTFDPADACLVTAPSSGSRGIYGAIGTAGEWGLKHGCAVAYTCAGKGIGAHDLRNNTVNLIDGLREAADAAGEESNFSATLGADELAAYNTAYPYRFAFKHAHSRQNPEASWDEYVLESIRFAFFAINHELMLRGFKQKRVRPGNTIVIASSVSNGGGASLRAAENDRNGLIDGVAVAEPNVAPRQLSPVRNFAIVQGDGPPLTAHSRPLYDYTTMLQLYQGCANLAAANAAAPSNLTNQTLCRNSCASLKEKGLLTAESPAMLADEAQAIINGYGILAEQNILQPAHYFLFVPEAIAVTYANSYSRSGVETNLCGYSFAATTGNHLLADPSDERAGWPRELDPVSVNLLFGTANGIPPTAGINLINNLSAGSGPRETRISTSASTGRQDMNLDGALMLRSLWTGSDPCTGEPLHGPMRDTHRKLRHGVLRTLAHGNLRCKPAVIVTGRSDSVLAVNHASRSYFGLNRSVEGSRSKLSYYEVLNAHHLDTLNGLPGFDERMIPLHYYFLKALDMVYSHLKEGAPLLPSQVVRTVPRGRVGGLVPPIDNHNVPDFKIDPDTDEIIFVNRQVRIPE